MNCRDLRRQRLLLAMSVVLFATYPALAGEERDAGEAQYYSIDVALLSFLPGEGLEACRSYGSGTASGNGTVGHWVKDGDRNFGVTVECRMKSHRFWATVRIEPSESDTLTEARVFELDLSEFEPQAIDMAEDDDGRGYRLNLMPSVKVAPAPKRFRSQDLRLENWSFPNCPIILNDQQYLGRISCSHGELAWLDIPGTALVEFSLIPFAEAKPWGVLNDGVVGLSRPDGTSLQISGVANGIHRDVLKGGPYQIWVRWKKPTHSLEEHQELVKEQVSKIRKQIEAGDLRLPTRAVERLEKMDGSKGGWLSSGLRPLGPEERVPATD